MFLQFVSFGVFCILASSSAIIYQLGLVGVPAILALIAASFANKRIGDKTKTLMFAKNKVLSS